ncbi:MAG: branched-chain amino acid aminotransferase [Bacteroidota bacterium]
MKYDIRIQKTTQSRLAEVDFSNLPFGRVFTDHMFVADYEDGEWKDARIVPFAPFQMHPAAMVLHYGQAIFEGMKAFKNKDGEPIFFRPAEHAKRINASAHRMCMPEFPADLFEDAIHQLVDLDRDWIPQGKESALYMRPFMIATDEFIGVRPSQKYRFIIFCCPVGAYYAKPVKLYVEQKYVRAVAGGVGEAKAAGNYGAALRPALEAQQKGYDQVMWTEAPDFKKIQEIGTMNIFFVLDGKVVTPKTDGAILKGITRKSIIDILRSKNIEVEERDIMIDELVEAHNNGQLSEAFGAGTAAVVSQVELIAYGDHKMQLDIANAKVSTEVKATIEGLRYGEIEDTFGWIEAVRSLEMA